MSIIRKAKIKDAKEIKELIDFYAKREMMLFRPFSEVYSNIRDFFVAEERNKIIGCCSLHILGSENNDINKAKIIAEIRSLAVKKNWQKKGIGTKLIEEVVEEARKLGISKICLLTIKPNIIFFEKIGFKKIAKEKISQKIWQECIKCPRFPLECNEIALIKKI